MVKPSLSGVSSAAAALKDACEAHWRPQQRSSDSTHIFVKSDKMTSMMLTPIVGDSAHSGKAFLTGQSQNFEFVDSADLQPQERNPGPALNLTSGKVIASSPKTVTMVVTSECLLDPSRNPSLDKAGVENMLKQYLGLKKIIWLWKGLMGDDQVSRGLTLNSCRY
ncbi:MAG: hypothetical protein WDW38_007380 [Sanguina aurantia]